MPPAATWGSAASMMGSSPQLLRDPAMMSWSPGRAPTQCIAGFPSTSFTLSGTARSTVGRLDASFDTTFSSQQPPNSSFSVGQPYFDGPPMAAMPLQVPTTSMSMSHLASSRVLTQAAPMGTSMNSGMLSYPPATYASSLSVPPTHAGAAFPAYAAVPSPVPSPVPTPPSSGVVLPQRAPTFSAAVAHVTAMAQATAMPVNPAQQPVGGQAPPTSGVLRAPHSQDFRSARSAEAPATPVPQHSPGPCAWAVASPSSTPLSVAPSQPSQPARVVSSYMANPRPATSPDYMAPSMPPSQLESAGAIPSHDPMAGPAPAHAAPGFAASLDDAPEQCVPALNEGTWYAMGQPAVRIEPTWCEEAWWFVAPIDYKGLEQYNVDSREVQDRIDSKLLAMEIQDKLPPLPPPRHWRAANESCRMA
mmetsp:Transcript_98167/g.278174  ORF Transcript_98167/g.278174 Transcript_98167/m.278174 type:complete len:418 (-) Transcript_98167:175-1428(-)